MAAPSRWRVSEIIQSLMKSAFKQSRRSLSCCRRHVSTTHCTSRKIADFKDGGRKHDSIDSGDVCSRWIGSVTAYRNDDGKGKGYQQRSTRSSLSPSSDREWCLRAANWTTIDATPKETGCWRLGLDHLMLNTDAGRRRIRR
jgi:hypothetical protein